MDKERGRERAGRERGHSGSRCCTAALGQGHGGHPGPPGSRREEGRQAGRQATKEKDSTHTYKVTWRGPSTLLGLQYMHASDAAQGKSRSDNVAHLVNRLTTVSQTTPCLACENHTKELQGLPAVRDKREASDTQIGLLGHRRLQKDTWAGKARQEPVWRAREAATTAESQPVLWTSKDC